MNTGKWKNRRACGCAALYLSTLFLLLPAAASADTHHGYVSAAIGGATYYDDDKLNDYDLDNSSLGWSVFGGYRVLHYLSIEAGYTYLGNYQAQGPLDNTEEQFQAIHLAAVGLLPLSDSWTLTLKLGGGAVRMKQRFSSQEDNEDTGTTVLLGLGTQWAPAKLVHWAFSLELNTYSFVTQQLEEEYKQSVNLLGLGARYTF